MRQIARLNPFCPRKTANGFYIAILLLAFLFLTTALPGQESGFLYKSPSGDCSVKFSDKPRKLFTHGHVQVAMRDSEGFQLWVWRLPKDDATGFWEKLEANGKGKFAQTWITLDGYRALRQSRYEFSTETGRSKLVEKVTVILGSRVYKMVAIRSADGDVRTELEREAHAFWSTFRSSRN